MKNIYLSLMTLILFCLNFAYGQGGCNTNVSICTQGVAGPFNFDGTAAGPPVDYANPTLCSTGLFGNPTNFGFILLNITQSGPLNLLVDGSATTGFIDVVVYDIPPGIDPCTAVQNSANEIGCNYAPANSGCTEFGSNFPCPSEVAAPNVTAGDLLMIIVHDYSTQSNSFTLDLAPTGAQTGAYTPTIAPTGPFDVTDPASVVGVSTLGGTWSASCGNCIDATTGQFDPAVAGPGTHQVCYTIGTAPCDGSDCSTITVNPVCTLTASATSTNVSCNGANDGTASATPANGTAPYTYAWSSGGTTAAVSNLAPGTHTVTITDNAGCTATATVTITQPTALNITANATDESCAGNDGTVTANATGGTTPYSYSWSHNAGLNSTNTTGLAAGTYTVTVTDAEGCTANATGGVTLVGSVVSSFTYNGNQCLTGNNFVFNNTGTAGVNYTWDFGDGNSSTQQNPSHTYAAAGSYTVSLTVSNGNCTDVFTQNVIVNPMPTATIAGTDPTCNGATDGSVNLIVANGTPNYGYAWSNGAISEDLSNVGAGTYNVTVSDLNGCQTTANITLNEPLVLTVTLAPTDASCDGVCDGAINTTVTGGTAPYSYAWTGGATGANPTALCDGGYSLTVTDALGCTATANTTLNNATTISANVTVVDANCGNADGSATANVTGGTGPFNYDWNNGAASGMTYNNIAAGSYTVDVTDALGCMASATGTVNNNAGPTSSITASTDVSCNGGTDGSATVTVNGGTGAITYSWAPTGGTSATATGLSANILYTVTATDNVGCVTTSTITLTEPTALTLVTNSTNSNCSQSNGSVSVTATGGTPGYTYSWDDGNGVVGTTDNVANLPAGTYVITVTDNAGCTETATQAITDLTGGTLAVNTTDISCNGNCDGTATANMTGGTLPFTYSWDDPNNTATASVTGLCQGTYTVTLTDGVGCQSSETITITEPDPLVVNIINAADVSCFGDTDGTAEAQVTGGTAPYTYLWNDAAAQTTAVASGLAPGGYSVQVTDAQGCVTSQTLTITEPDEIILTSGNIDAHCGLADGQAYVDVVSGGVGPFTYAWSGGNTSVTDTAFNVAAGTITATVTDNTGCSVISTATVGDIPAATLTITNVNDPLCNADCNGTATVSVSGTGTAPYNYSWTGGQTTSTVTDLCDGMHTVTVTDANGCITTADVTVTEPDQLAIIINPTDPLCFGSCDGILQAIVSGGTVPYNYSWDDPLTQASVNATNLCGDGTVYTVTVTDANGCQLDKGGLLTDPPQIVLDSTVTDATCGQPDGQACVSAQGGAGGYTYNWLIDGTTTACLSNVSANTYIAEVTDANGCTEQISVTVSDGNGPSATISAQTDVSCFDFTDGEATAQIVGGSQPYSYLWDANANNQTTPTASNLGAGTYSFTVTDATGCVASTSVTIMEPDSIIIQGLTTDPSCFQYSDGQIVASAIGGNGGYTYQWDDPQNQTTATATGLTDGPYNVTVTDVDGCVNTDQFELFDPLQFTAIPSHTDLTCNNSCDGTATLTPNNGILPFNYQWNDPNTQSTAAATNLCAGTVQGIITDANLCADTVLITITEPLVLTATIDVSGNVSCNATCDGFANAVAAGGTAPYTYAWSNGDVTATATNLCAGNFTITITDANGCTATDNVTISEPAALNGVMTSTDALCYGADDGTATYTVAGGTAPYAYAWDDLYFQNTPQADSLLAGMYEVVVTDANGCLLNESVLIGQPLQIAANLNITNTNCGQNNGEVCAGISGGTAPYQPSWNDPFNQTTLCALAISAGTYTLTVIDGNNCVFDTIVNVNDVAGPVVTLDGSINPSCSGLTDGSINMTASGGVTPYTTYQWIDANSTPVGPANTDDLLNVGVGCYTLEIEDNAGCYYALTECLTEPLPLNSSILNAADNTCFAACDGNAEVSVNGGTTPYNIAWNNGVTNTANPSLCAGNYTVDITDANGCTSSSSVTITEPDELISSILNVDNTSCDASCDGAVSISIVGGTLPYLNTWNPNVSSNTIASNLCAGGYSVGTTDANGCSATINATVNSPSALSAALTTTDATCGNCNGTVTFTVSGGTAPYTYLWDDGQTTQTATNVCAGVFGGTATDANGCIISLVVNVVNIPGPTINTINFTEPTCFGLSNGTATVDLTNGTQPFNFFWPSSGATNPTATGIASGNHCVEVTDANGCFATACVFVTEPALLVGIPDGSDTICFGDSTQIWASGSGGVTPYTISWTGANTTGFTGQGPIFVGPSFNEDYCFRVADANGCLSTTECINIAVTPELEVTLPADLFICDGDDFNITGTYAGGNGDPYTYEWFENAYPSAVIGNSDNLTVTPSGPTYYYVELNDGCSTPAVDSILISLNNNPSAFLNVVNPEECNPGTINFIANSDIGVSYEWDYDCDGIVDDITSTGTSSHVYDSAAIYDVCLTVVSTEGCATSISEIGGVEIFPLPVADFGYTPGQTTMTDPYVYLSDQSTGAVGWGWDPNGDGDIDTITQNAVYEFIAPGTYDMYLYVTSIDGCRDSISKPFTVLPDQNIYVPNAFSPDGDGMNDLFFVNGIGLSDQTFDLYVFNRWGDIIWEGHNPSASWDGNVGSVEAQQDVYVWKLFTEDVNGNKIEMTGHVTLIR